MNYLFFDIECSDGMHICSFGYVITDADFNVLKKEDILINPEAPFRLSRYKGEPQIQLGYPKEVFYAAPNFVARYEKIKRILEKKNQLVLGHSVLNDVNFLQIACDRYSKPHFEYSFIDEQYIYKAMNEGKSVSTALEKIAEVYEIEPESLHRSDDDSKTTMEIVRRMCKDKHTTIDKLADEYPLSKGKVENGVVKRFVTEPYKWFCSAAFDVKPKFDEKKKAEGKTLEKNEKNKFFYGKKFCFATKLERTIPLKIYTLVEMITARGGEYTDNPADCDVFVRHKTSKCFRTQYAMQHKTAKIIPFETLLSLLETKYNDVVPYEFKGDYVGKKPKTVETGVSHVESKPSSIGDIVKSKPQQQRNAQANNNRKKKRRKNAGWNAYLKNQKPKQGAKGEKNESGTNKNDKAGD